MQIALMAGNFNPPGRHHREIARRLADEFDRVLIVPCGPFPNRPLTFDTPPIHRAVMVDLTFEDIPKTTIELFDLEDAKFTPNIDLDVRFGKSGTIWHVVPAEWVKGGVTSFVQQEWERGKEIWQLGKFVVLHPPGQIPSPENLPPNHRLLAFDYSDASDEIRARVVNHKPIDGLVPSRVQAYIDRHGLYRNTAATRDTRVEFHQPKLILEVADRNEKAARWAEELRAYEATNDADLIAVLGGDGTMLRSIRKHWRRRLPFFGLNAGHLGFLLNDIAAPIVPSTSLLLYQLPLLWVEVEPLHGPPIRGLAFNDAWVERATGQTAWVRVEVAGKTRLEKVVADGMLVSTAAGSTSYARAMGAPPLPFHTPILLLVGSNVLYPSGWKCAALPIESDVFIETLDPNKRPLIGYIDGQAKGEVRSMRIRVSRIAAAELAFLQEHNPAEKLARLQFASGGL